MALRRESVQLAEKEAKEGAQERGIKFIIAKTSYLYW